MNSFVKHVIGNPYSRKPADLGLTVTINIDLSRKDEHRHFLPETAGTNPLEMKHKVIFTK